MMSAPKTGRSWFVGHDAFIQSYYTLYLAVLLPHLTMTSSSTIVDDTGQTSFHRADYCPKMKYCPEGSHVMCMYYNENNRAGPRCSNAQNVSVTPELANKFLDVSNAVRSRVAQGKEKGKDGNYLPRAYGMFRLNWDSELATFAQVLANQCILKHDLCRATHRFPDPGQAVGLVRFTYPDWLPVSKTASFTETGLNPAKLLYSTTTVLKYWYGQKNYVTPRMITSYTETTADPTTKLGQLYMKMIYGPATHMGCGISAFTEYVFFDNNAALNYNSVLIICNYSAGPRKGKAVFNTVPPGDTLEPFSRCGCPVGSEGDEECLCKEKYGDTSPTLLKHTEPSCPAGEDCDPTVVVLPIFTVEDAPPEKLIHRSYSNASIGNPVDAGVFGRNGFNFLNNKRNFYKADQIANKSQAKYNSKAGYVPETNYAKKNIRPTTFQHRKIAIRNRYFDNNHNKMKTSETKKTRTSPRKQNSLFNRAAKFQLPETQPVRTERKTLVKDVIPRKDFTNAKQLVNDYLYGKNHSMKAKYLSKYNMLNYGIHETKDKTISTKHVPVHGSDQPLEESDVANYKVEPIHNIHKNIIHEKKLKTHDNELEQEHVIHAEHRSVEDHEAIKKFIENEHQLNEIFNMLKASNLQIDGKETVKHNNLSSHEQEAKMDFLNIFTHKHANQRADYDSLINTVTEETDNKLMALLDTLEQEVKHIELRDKDKQLFDKKIRKIYGKVVGKPVNLPDFNKSITHIKLNVKNSNNDVTASRVIQEPIQQNPTEEPINEKEIIRTTRSENNFKSTSETNEMKHNDNVKTTTTSYNVEGDKYDERHLYKSRYNSREIKTNYKSGEFNGKTYHEDDNDREYEGEKKTYKNNEFDTYNRDNNEEQYRGTTKKHKNRYINDRVEDEISPRRANSELVRRLRNKLEYQTKNYDTDPVKNKNYYLSHGAGNDDLLSIERRRFYTEKLENIERKLQMRNYRPKKDKPRHMRPMRPTQRKSENQMDIYGRGRFAHGY